MVMAEEINPMGRTRLGPKINNNNHPPTTNQNANRKQRKRKRLSAILDTLHGQNNNVIHYTNNNYNNNQYVIKCEPLDTEVAETERCISNAESLTETNQETGQYISNTPFLQFPYSPEFSDCGTTRPVLNILKSSQIKNENTLVYALPTPPQEFPLDLSMKSNSKYYSLPKNKFNVIRQVSIVKDDPQTKDSMATHFNLNVSPVVEEMPHGSNLAYVCPVCGQMFSVFDRLSKHVASRHKQKTANPDTVKSYVCDVCSRSFSRSDMLTRHFRLHSGNKPYSCKSCGQVSVILFIII
jgi:DNA-directed RNA polymerase subunit RPC12/RpoP